MDRRLRVVGNEPERTLLQVNTESGARAHLHDLDDREAGLRTLCGLYAEDDEPESYEFEVCSRCLRAARARGHPVDEPGYFERPLATYYSDRWGRLGSRE